jgi:hypothetical protein
MKEETEGFEGTIDLFDNPNPAEFSRIGCRTSPISKVQVKTLELVPKTEVLEQPHFF